MAASLRTRTRPRGSGPRSHAPGSIGRGAASPEPRDIRIGERVIGERQPLFVTAEIGVTCNYDLAMTKELIDVACEAGADAVKLIFWFPDEIMSDTTVTYAYETLQGTVRENMYAMLQKLRFSLQQWREVKAHADRRKIVLFATVNSPSGIDYAEALGLPAYKLSSWDFNYVPLWRRIAALGKPMLIDTGPVTMAEVAKVMQILRDAGQDQTVLIHCFHTDDRAAMNMRSIPYLRQAFHTLVGFSAKDCRDETDIMAVSLGASVIEKRLTLSRSRPGHHHILSKEPKEFAAYVRMIRDVQAALGVEALLPSPADLNERRRWFRHVVATRMIPKGTRMTADMLDGRRPEAGLAPEWLPLFIGRLAKRDIQPNEALTWEDL